MIYILFKNGDKNMVNDDGYITDDELDQLKFEVENLYGKITYKQYRKLWDIIEDIELDMSIRKENR